jgi:hypothetical protein
VEWRDKENKREERNNLIDDRKEVEIVRVIGDRGRNDN